MKSSRKDTADEIAKMRSDIHARVKSGADQHPLYRITISRTADGAAEYLQIIHEDSFSANIVLIGSKFEINDVRPK